MASDAEIAFALYRGGFLRPCEYEVWCRSQCGETVYSMRGQYIREASGTSFSSRTLYDWVLKARAAIDASRLITSDPNEPPERNPFKISLATGSRVRDSDDPTPQRKTYRSFFPDAERLRSHGKLPR